MRAGGRGELQQLRRRLMVALVVVGAREERRLARALRHEAREARLRVTRLRTRAQVVAGRRRGAQVLLRAHRKARVGVVVVAVEAEPEGAVVGWMRHRRA